MKGKVITEEQFRAFMRALQEEERSEATISKYLRDVRAFALFLENGGEWVTLSKDGVLAYKRALISRGYRVSSINSMLAALDKFFRFLERPDLIVHRLKMQRRVYCPPEKELSKEDYERLVRTAEEKGKRRISLILQTICGTGIRVSELSSITAEAVQKGEAVVSCKGKTRSVFLVKELRKKLLRYITEQGITNGPVFQTKRGKPLSRISIWRDMKKLCEEARVDRAKVFPHNLRHLFARTFYRLEKDIAKLADLLGHSSIDTTRIYIVSTGAEHRRRMESMRLIL